MRFLIYGKGWISGMILKYLSDNKYDFVEGVSRVDDIPSVKNELDKVKPTHIMCLIGRTHGFVNGKEYPTIDYLEQKGKLVENIRDNLFSQVALAILCQERNIHLNCIATGCIFNYDETHTTTKGFTEEDLPNFFDSSYSIVKGFNDRLMHLLPVASLRIRMPIVAEPNPRNFITKITKYDKICSADNSMTILDDFIPIMVDLSKRHFIGTLNLTNPGVINHNEILQMYQEIVDSKFTWKNFTYEEQQVLLANGRSNNYLDTTLLESMYTVPNIKDSMREVLKRMKTFM
jgi:dTDP-4-dehydrorhamnose reductase